MAPNATMHEQLTMVKHKFYSVFGHGSEGLFFSPGRVNLIGEHTDYNGGHVFPCTISLGIWAAAARCPDGRVRLHSLNSPQVGTQEFELPPPVFNESHDWANYPLGVLRILADEGYHMPGGLDILYAGNLPNGAGLSSSASLEVLTGVICNELFHLDISMTQIALLAQKAENNYVGVRCGIMDQFTVAMGLEGCAILLDCNSLVHHYSRLALNDCRIVLANTNVTHSLGSSGYNERRAQCEAALEDVRAALPEYASLSAWGALSETEFNALAKYIKNPVCFRRAKHAVYENQRTLQAVEALTNDDVDRFGELMRQSHESLRDDYEVSCKELDIMAELAWKHPGVVGARMTGGGFGGCTVNLVHEADIEHFCQEAGTAYEQATGLHPEFYVADVAGGARREELP